MKLFDYETYEDYGKEWLFQVLSIPKKFALLDATVQWDDYGGDEIFPILILSIGNKALCGFTFRWKRFEFFIQLFDTAPRNLEWYRRGEDKYESLD